MSDDSKADPPKAPRAIPRDYDLHSWAVSLGISTEELRQIIAEVGDSAAAVRRKLAER